MSPKAFWGTVRCEGSVKKEITEGLLKSLVKNKPDQGRVEVSDTKRAGLRVRVSSSGRASWLYEKRVKGGTKRRQTLGTWPTMGLSEARALALEIEAEAAKGIDRVEETRVQKARREADAAKRISVQQALDAYRDLHLDTIKTGSERYRQISQALGEHLGTAIGELTRKDIQAAVDAKAQAGRRPYANRVRSALVAFANWAFLRGYIDEPIGAGVARATKERARDRVLSLAEIREIWAATYDMGKLWGPFFRVLILTGQRRSEISELRWSELDFDARLIVKPGTATKNGKPHATHLSAAGLQELDALRPEVSKTEFVFSFDGVRPVANPSHAKSRLDQLLRAEFEPWRIHDIRTAMATALANAGEPENIVDRILNHAASGSAPSAVARVYNQADLLPQRAKALDRWAELVTQTNAQVIRIGSNE